MGQLQTFPALPGLRTHLIGRPLKPRPGAYSASAEEIPLQAQRELPVMAGCLVRLVLEAGLAAGHQVHHDVGTQGACTPGQFFEHPPAQSTSDPSHSPVSSPK